jgi:predicted nucleic acid-binding protein
MKVLVDTNVILDVLLNRTAFFDNSREIFGLAEHRQIGALISASAMTDIFYFVHKNCKATSAVYQIVDDLCGVFTIAPVCETTITAALALRWKDFEDAVQYMTAKENGADYIITRNKDDYETADIPCLSPADFGAHFNTIEGKSF